MCRKDGGLVDVGAIPYQQAIEQMEAASKSGASKVDAHLAAEAAEQVEA